MARLWIVSQPPYSLRCGSLSLARCEGVAPPGLVLCQRKLAVPYLAIDLVCLWEEVSSGSSQAAVWNRNPGHPSFPELSPLRFGSGLQAPLNPATSFPVSGTEGRLWDGSPPQSREPVPVRNLTSIMHTHIFLLPVGEP